MRDKAKLATVGFPLFLIPIAHLSFTAAIVVALLWYLIWPLVLAIIVDDALAS